MDYLELLNQIFDLCVVPLLGVLTTFLISFIKKKTAELTETSNNTKMNKYVTLLSQTIADCVAATNQTYVDSLKGENAFDKEAQEVAFEKTYKAVMQVINEDAAEYLTTIYGDLESYIRTKIESEVKIQKKGA